MGRYYRHPVAPIIDYSYKLPFQELFQAMQMKEQQQAQSIKTLRDSEAKMDQIFQATPGAGPDEKVRAQKMEEFNTFVQEMSQEDLTKGESINDINNYISGFARDEDVKAITQRYGQYESALKELKEMKKKNGKITPEQSYFFDHSIRDYNKKGEYDRDATWSGVSGYYDYQKELRDIGDKIKPYIRTGGIQEDGKYRYTIKNTDTSLQRVRDAMYGGMSSMARAALEDEYSIAKDQHARVGKEMPEGLGTFEEYVVGRSQDIAGAFTRHDREIGNIGSDPDYAERIKGAGEMTMAASPVHKISGADVATAFSTRRSNDLLLRQTKNKLKEAGLDLDNKSADIAKWKKDNQENLGARELYNEYEGLTQQLQQTDQFLQGVSEAQRAKNPDYWYDKYADLKSDKWIGGDGRMTFEDANGKKQVIQINNARDLEEAIVQNKFKIDPSNAAGSVWDTATDFLGFRNPTGGIATPWGRKQVYPGEGTGEGQQGYADARFQLQMLYDEVNQDFQDFAMEEEGLASNVTIINPSSSSKLGRMRDLIQDNAQSGATLFKSLEGGETLGDFLEAKTKKGDKVDRNNIRVDFTDGASANGNPVMWVSAYDKDGAEVINKPFEYLAETDEEARILSESIITAGQMNQNKSQVRLGERVAANSIKKNLEATGLLQTPSVIARIKSAGSEGIINSVPGYEQKLRLHAIAPNRKISYTLLHEASPGNWEPVKLTTVTPEGQLITDEAQEDNLDGYGLTKIAWLMWKEQRAAQTGTGYDPISDSFIKIQ